MLDDAVEEQRVGAAFDLFLFDAAKQVVDSALEYVEKDASGTQVDVAAHKVLDQEKLRNYSRVSHFVDYVDADSLQVINVDQPVLFVPVGDLLQGSVLHQVGRKQVQIRVDGLDEVFVYFLVDFIVKLVDFLS